jgi:hypothetical protein
MQRRSTTARPDLTVEEILEDLTLDLKSTDPVELIFDDGALEFLIGVKHAPKNAKGENEHAY